MIKRLLGITGLAACGSFLVGCNQGNETCSKMTTSLFRTFLEPEDAHYLAIQFLKSFPVIRLFPIKKYSSLRSTVFGQEFIFPVGVAAGFDKNGECLSAYTDLGFGFAEIGTVTPIPQPGNPKPRLFRLLEDRAIINRMGFNNDGYDAAFERLKYFRLHKDDPLIVGVNIGMNKFAENPNDDYATGIRTFYAEADYIVINISSPNTPNLKTFQEKQKLITLLSHVKKEIDQFKGLKKRPILLKLSPDLTSAQCSDIAEIICLPESVVSGLILTNTTVDRSIELKSIQKSEIGGLSGDPIREKSTQMIRQFYTLTKGNIPIIGVGGISNGQDAYDKIINGASLVQVYSSVALDGFSKANQINRELNAILKEKGIINIQQAVGSAITFK